MRALVTVFGQDRVGIIARVCQCLSEHNINILDISQTLLGNNFTMVMVVDTSGSAEPFGDLAATLSSLGEEMGLSIRIQKEAIFNAMHKI